MAFSELEEMRARSERLSDAILDLEERDIPNTEYQIRVSTTRLKHLNEKRTRMKKDYDALNEEILKAESEEDLDTPIVITDLFNISNFQFINNFKQ